MPFDPLRVKELFVAAVELPPGPERQAFLDRACGNDAEQRRIAARLSSLDSVIGAQLRKLDVLRAHKKGLMQQLFPSPEGD